MSVKRGKADSSDGEPTSLLLRLLQPKTTKEQITDTSIPATQNVIQFVPNRVVSLRKSKNHLTLIASTDVECLLILGDLPMVIAIRNAFVRLLV